LTSSKNPTTSLFFMYPKRYIFLIHVIQGSKLKLNLSASVILSHWLKLGPSTQFDTSVDATLVYDVKYIQEMRLLLCSLFLVFGLVYVHCNCPVGTSGNSVTGCVNDCSSAPDVGKCYRKISSISPAVRTTLRNNGRRNSDSSCYNLCRDDTCNMVYSWMAQEVFPVWSILGYCLILLPMPGGKMYKSLTMTFG
jgi:hypothetical protein